MPRLPRALATASMAAAALAVLACTREHRAAPESSRSGASAPSASRGSALLAATSDSLPQFAGALMRCFSCHLDEGLRANAMPLAGAYARLPAYHPRTGRVITIEDRVNSCFTRSLAGRPLPEHGRDMADIVAYLRTLSAAPGDAHAPHVGLPALPTPRSVDTTRGRLVFAARCARCHGADGAGIPPVPPLWGGRSYSIGASMARVSRAAAFIRYNMPYDSAGTLDDRTAWDVAAYIDSKPRPDTHGKSGDWPRGDAPRDVPYDTRNHVALHPPPLLPAAR